MAVNPINEVVRLKHNLQGAGYLKRGRPPKFSATQFYPRALENDLFDTLRAELDRLAELNTVAALQGIRDDLNEMNALQIELSAEFVNRSRQIGERIAENAGANFSKQVDMIIGRPYYPPGFQAPILNDWHEEFQTLCISAAQDGKKAIAATVAIAKEKGWNKGQLEAEIKKILPPETRHRAELIARTETGKLNSRCTLATYEEVGIKYYKWLTTMDGRERESHAELNGVICSVENPDVYFKENPENPLRPLEFARTGKMYHGHPGTDFQCRCSMVMWDPEIDGQFEVKEDQRRAELERQEAEEKARQEEEERKAKEREAEEARKRQEAEEKARAEMEEKARKKAEAKYKRELKKAEEAAKKAKEAEEAAKATKSQAESTLRLLQAANARHANRTAEQVENIRKRWEWRTKWHELSIKLKEYESFRETSAYKKLSKPDRTRVDFYVNYLRRLYNSKYPSGKEEAVFVYIKNLYDCLDRYREKGEYIINYTSMLKQGQKEMKANKTMDAKKLFANDEEARDMLTRFGVVKGKPMTLEEADNGKENPSYNKVNKSDINCQSCVVVHEMRMRGYNVFTLPKTSSNADFLSRKTEAAWKNVKPYTIKSNGLNEAVKELKDFAKEKGRYNVVVEWKRGRSGHIFTVINDGKEIYIHEAQSTNSKRWKMPLEEYLKDAKINVVFGKPSIYRVDNAELDFDNIEGIFSIYPK